MELGEEQGEGEEAGVQKEAGEGGVVKEEVGGIGAVGGEVEMGLLDGEQEVAEEEEEEVLGMVAAVEKQMVIQMVIQMAMKMVVGKALRHRHYLLWMAMIPIWIQKWSRSGRLQTVGVEKMIVLSGSRRALQGITKWQKYMLATYHP